MSDLPNKPSELIQLAVDDLEKAENSPDYIIDMAHWHEPLGDGQCAVCFAGAIMAGTLGADPRVPANVNLAGPSIRTDDWKLSGLDSLQTHAWNSALESFRQASMISSKDRDVLEEYMTLRHALSSLPINYADSPDQFKSGMRSLADLFERYGY